MSEQLSATPGLLYTFPVFADYIVEEWSPAPAGEVQEHLDAGGETYSSTETNPGEVVQAKLAVKATKTIPANHTVLASTTPARNYIVTDINPMRDGALTKFTCKLTYRESMPNPT